MLSILSEIPKAISIIIYLANEAYIGLIGGFWYFLVKYGLQPSYSYPMLASNSSFMEFYSYLFNNLYLQIASFLIVLSSVYVMFASSTLNERTIGSTLTRFSFAALVFVGSLEISQLILKFSFYTFQVVWNYDSLNWYSLLSVTNVNANILVPLSQVGTSNALAEFFLLSWLFAATFSLLSMLLIRQAIVIFLSLVLPLFSLLFVTKQSSRLPAKLWLLYIESAFLPIFVMVILVLVHIFYGDFILQIAFLSLAVLLPTIFMSNSLVYRSASFQSAYGELSTSNLISAAASQAGYIRSISSGNSSLSSMGNMMTYPIWSKERGGAGPIKSNGSKRTGIDWKVLNDEKLNYRRSW